jgi:uncharacterized DUF497 family protein
LRFTWDPAKAERNQRIHGISFETAAEVFGDSNHVVGDNYFIESDGEQRYQVIGMTGKLVLLLVVFVERRQPDIEVIHLISARKAVDYEEGIYNDQFR